MLKTTFLQKDFFQKKGVLTALGTAGCALAIGFVMQSSDAAQYRYGTVAGPAPLLTSADGRDPRNALVEVQSIALTSAEYDNTIAVPTPVADVKMPEAPQSTLPEPMLMADQIDPDTEAKTLTAADPEPTPACVISAHATPKAAAMVDLSLTAPCMPNERVTVHHNGMIFTETTSANGSLDVVVPALATNAVFVLAFTNGEGAVAQAQVEDIIDFDRSVLQWKGQSGFQIHAREFGADYGDKGHLWVEEPGDVADLVTGQGGMMTRHGDTRAADPLLAEVYSFPKDTNGRAGTVALSVEAEVTAANCGIEIEAQSLELQTDGSIKTQNLTLPVPECDEVGGFLVLNNLLRDLNVAAR